MEKLLIIISLVALMLGGWFLYHKPTNTNQPQNQTKKVVKIGILSQKSSKTYETSLATMKQKLTGLGYKIEYFQEEIKNNDDYPKAAKKYVDLEVDIIVTNSTPATKAVITVTNKIPIVFGSVGDPVANGIVENLDSSGKNITGVSSLSVDLTAKRLELIKQAQPNITKVYFIHEPGETSSENALKKVNVEADRLNMTLIQKNASNAAELKKVANSLNSKAAEAILVSASAMIWANIDKLIESQNRERILLVGVDRTMAERGVVFSYGPDYKVMGEQLASLVDQILQGVKPQYLPIQRPKKVELIYNKSAALKIGLTIPQDFLAKVDQTIGQ